MKCWLSLAVIIFAAISTRAQHRIVCYFESWAVYNSGNEKFDVENIDPSLCTHHIYSFVGVGEDGSVLLLDSDNDINGGAMKRFTGMKNSHPDIKTMVSIGGWDEGSEKFSHVVNDNSLRAKFVDSIVSFLKEHGFDGIDVDWEYPTQRGGIRSDRETFVTLLSELRSRFDENGFILSAAVGAGEGTADEAYDIPQISKYLDFINVMTYDFHGEWDSVTGENSPLYASAYDKRNGDTSNNADASIKYWISKGAPNSKLNLGLGSYGHAFILQNSAQHTVGSPISGPGNPDYLGYNKICENNWHEDWDNDQQVPYAYSGNQWVGYDNADSFTIKAQYIVDNGLGGGMIWAIDTDDFLGTCGKGKYPLLTALNSVLRGGSSGTQPTEHTAPTEPTNITPSNGVCTKEGFVRDPNQCEKFYYCESVNGQFQVDSFTCPGGTLYDPSIETCNYASEVSC